MDSLRTAEDSARPAWTIVLGSTLVSILIVVSIHMVFYRSPRKKTPRWRKLALRIDQIPTDKPADVFQRDLQSIINGAPDLKECVTSIEHHLLVQRNARMACATATFYTSLDGTELVAKLKQAGSRHPYRFDVDFHGMTPLYEDPAGADVDVIAVPGLGAHAIGSWKSPTGNDVWLRDYLPHDIRGIRVLLYGYNTSLLGNDSRESVQDLGVRFLEAIKAFRGDTAEHRPIILIGHSLGGLLIKEALVRAHRRLGDLQNSNICKACYALLLFGVPNLGLRNEELRSIVQDRRVEVLVQDLLLDNDSEPTPFLKRIATEFSECCKGQYKVVSFFERKPSPTVEVRPDGTIDKTKTVAMTLMVTEKSATSTGLTASADENNIPLPTDHSGLVKYESRVGEEYSIVKEKLRILVTEAKGEVGRRFEEEYLCKPKSLLVQECLQSLAFGEMNDRRSDITTAAKGTCGWLLSHETYQRWVAEHGLLWIRGKPGAGKSTLLKHALQKHRRLSPAKDVRAFFFFFHGRGSDLQKSPLGLFRSLLHQFLCLMADELPEVVNKFQHHRDTFGTPGAKWQWHTEDLKILIQSALPKILRKYTVLFFIDALDECGEVHALELVAFFQKLLSHPTTSSKLGICFTCRHYPILTLDYGSSICVEHGNKDDIAAYLEQRVTKSRIQLDSTLLPAITSRAAGVFMWARLVMDQLEESLREGKDPNKLQGDIQRIPPDLDSLYDELVKRMKDRAKSLKIVQWIFCARRPLSLDGLSWAMVLDAGTQHKSFRDCQDADDYTSDRAVMERKVKTLSCGLAEIVQGSYGPIVQFIHESVKDFFLQKGLSALDDTVAAETETAKADIAVGMAHYQLSRTCIRYLAMEEIAQSTVSDRDGLLSAYPLLRYAAIAWIAHAKKSQAMNVPQDDLLDYFGWPSETLLQSLVRIHQTIRDSRDANLPRLSNETSMVHIVSSYGLIGPLQVILKRADQVDIDIDGRDHFGRTPLSLAAKKGREVVVELLLATGKVNIDSENDKHLTPLLYAAKYGKEAVVKLLLATGKVDIDSKNKHSWTPLKLAAENGREAVVTLLLATGKVDIDLKDFRYCQTPLSGAAERGHQAVVKLLLATGKVDVNSKDNYGRTPLSYAAEHGHKAVVKLLLATGTVDTDSKDSQYGQTPLSYAAENGHKAVVNLLLATGKVDVNSKDKRCRTPLSWAAERGHEAVVKLLLATRMVDIDSNDKRGRTPLSWAAERGCETVVKLLLAIGMVDIDSKDKRGRTPLWYADWRGQEAVVKLLLAPGKDVD